MSLSFSQVLSGFGVWLLAGERPTGRSACAFVCIALARIGSVDPLLDELRQQLEEVLRTSVELPN
ncbi:MAG: hypothetical protein AAGG48_24095 [Planctomycetota bacterium]